MAISAYLVYALVCSTPVAYILIFVIYRYVNYLSYRYRSNIPCVPLDDPLSGSAKKFLFSKERSVTENIMQFAKENPQSDIFYMMAGPKPIVASRDADLYYQVFVKDGGKNTDRFYSGVPDEGLEYSLLNSHGKDWHRTRKALAPTLSHSNLIKRNVHTDIAEVTEKFISGLNGIIREKGTGVFKDVNRLFRNYALGVVWAIGFNQHDQVDFSDENDDFVESFVQWAKLASLSIVRFFFYVPSLRFLLFRLITMFNLSSISAIAQNRTMDIVKQVRQKKEMAASKKRFIYDMVDLYIEKKISKIELTGNSLFFTLAGFETTAGTLTALMWFLAKDEDKQAKLRLDLIKYGQESLYLDWCLKETMRLSPPANTGRTIEEDFEWKGYKILKGMILILAPQILHINEKYWGPDCEEFRPERFEDTRQHHPAQYAPFGLGVRNCLGYHLAYLQMKTVIARFLLQFRVSCSEHTPKKLRFENGYDMFAFSNTLKNGISLRIDSIIHKT